ncbi:fibronectin type III domain-containing protein [Flavobacteriaceae bacterium M23B6Z8]
MRKLNIFLLLSIISLSLFSNSDESTKTSETLDTSTLIYAYGTYNLINSATDQTIQPLSGGEVIDLSVTGNQLNIQAILPPAAASVTFTSHNGAYTLTQSVAPFAYRDDTNGDYHNWDPGTGTVTITVDYYSGTEGTGTLLATDTLTLTFTAADILAPTAPVSVVSSVSFTQAEIGWNTPYDNIGVTGYKVYNANDTLLADAGDVHTYTITGLSPGTAYSYYVKAYDAAGNESAASSTLNFTTWQELSAQDNAAADSDQNANGSFSPSFAANLSTVTDASEGTYALKATTTQDGYRYIYYDFTAEAGESYQLTYKAKKIGSGTNVGWYNWVGVSYRSSSSVTSSNWQSGIVNFTADTTQVTMRLYFILPGDPIGTEVYLDDVSIVCTSCNAPPVTDTTPPVAPTALTSANTTATATTLSWSAATDDTGVTGYKVYRDGNLMATLGNVLSYDATGLNGSTTYAFTVSAMDAAGNESPVSNVTSVSTLNGSPELYTEASAAAKLNESAGYGSWSNNYYLSVETTDVAHGSRAMKITRSGNYTLSTYTFNTTPGDTYTITGKIKANTLNEQYISMLDFTNVTTDTGRSPNTVWQAFTYIAEASGSTARIRIASSNGGGVSGDYLMLDELSIKCSSCTTDTQAPSVPGGLTATNITTTSATLNWNAATDTNGVTGYKVYKNGQLEATLGNVLTYDFTGLSQSTTYAVSVLAMDGAGNESAQSTALNFTTQTQQTGGNPELYLETSAAGIANEANDKGSWDNNYYLSVETTDVIEGSYALRINRSGTYTTSTYSFTTAPGTVYTITGKIKVNVVSEQYISMQGFTNVQADQGRTPTTSWAPFTYTAEAQSNSASIRIAASNGAGTSGDYLILDAFSIKEGVPVNAPYGSYNLIDASNGSSIAQLQPQDTLNLTATGTQLNIQAVPPASVGSVKFTSHAGSYTLTESGSPYAYRGHVSGVYNAWDPGVGDVSITIAYYSNAGGAGTLLGSDVLDLHFEQTADTQNPTPPTASLGSVTHDSAALSWTPGTDNVAVTGYRLYLNGNLHATLGTAGSYTLINLNSDTAYTTYLTAIDAAGNESVASNTLSFTTSLPPDTTAPLVQSLQLSLVTDTQATFIWEEATDNIGVTEYRLYNADGSLRASMPKIKAYTVNGLTPNTAYGFYLTALDASGNESTNSNTINLITKNVYLAQELMPQDNAATGDLNSNGSWMKSFQTNLIPVSTNTTSGAYSLEATADQSSYRYIYYTLNTISGETYRLTADTKRTTVGTQNWTNWQGAYNSNVYGYGALQGTNWETRTIVFTPYTTSVTIRLYVNSTTSSTAGSQLLLDNVSIICITCDQTDTTPPSATTVSATNTTDTTTDLSWTAATDDTAVTAYEIYRNNTLIVTVNGSTTSYTATALNAQTTYNFKVIAKDASGNQSADSNLLAVTTTTTPDTEAPQIGSLSVASITGTSVELNWTAATDNIGVTGYTLYRDGSLINSFPAGVTSGNASGLSELTGYDFQLKATDAAGNESAFSTTLTVTTADATAPSAPTLSPVAATQSTLEFSLSGASDNSGSIEVYHIFVDGVQQAEIPGNSTAHTITGLNTDTAYDITAKALDVAGNQSSSSNMITMTTNTVPDTTVPSPPVTSIVEQTFESITVSWSGATDNVGVTGYFLYLNNNPQVQIGGSQNQYTFAGLQPQTTYQISVKAIDETGNESVYSNVVTAVTAAASPYELVALSDENYRYSRTYQDALTETDEIIYSKQVIENIIYYDGLGRPIQEIAIKQTPEADDLIKPITYDSYGRVAREYLPYPVTRTNGNFGELASDPLTEINTYYQEAYPEDMDVNNPNPFSETQYEPSPMQRVLKQAAPGKDWRMGGSHEIKFLFDSNGLDEVCLFQVDLSQGKENPQLIGTGQTYYDMGQLTKTITKDENHDGTASKLHTTEEFKDKQGRVVLKRTYATLDGLVEAHDTYYIYDDFGNLTYVLPPKVDTSDGVSATELSELCYKYKYDHRNRMVEKKIPGKDKEYIVYNELDQPVLTQDAFLRAQGKWLYTKYDAFGRVVQTGFFSLTGNRQAVITAMENYYNGGSHVVFEQKSGNSYTNQSYPVANTELLTENYYDNYNFDLSGLTLPSTTSVGTDIISGLKTKGLATGSKVKVLDQSQWITTITGYDNRRRPVYTQSSNPYLETEDIAETKLDFTGRALQVKTQHTKDTNTPIEVVENFSYDASGRVLTQTHSVGNQTELIAQNQYDKIGQLVTKNVGNTISSPLQQVDYTYTIRGWLKEINDVNSLGSDLFAFKIGYNEGANALYNGNISSTSWRTNNTDNNLKQYNYSYDALNRITDAIGVTTNVFDVTGITYDKMGNIKTLNRQGAVVAQPQLSNSGDYSLMDGLTYSYDTGNKLQSVQDSGNGTYGFKDGANTTTEYTYDANGNMIKDDNKGITNITYNHLNLPTQVTMADGTISYIYDAAGMKLKKIVNNTAESSVTSTEYAGNYIYEDGNLQFFNNAEGYVEEDGSGGYNYIFQYKDHLGNVRLSYSDLNNNGTIEASSEILEENNYYPLGLKHKGYNNVINGTDHPYGFGGKEEQDELGLGWHDFHARNYDASLGRWMNIDPLAELDYSLTPYNYAMNNPIFFSDPTGLSTHVVLQEDGTYKVVGGDLEDDDKNIYIIAYDEDGNAHNTGISIGESLTMYSFYNADEQDDESQQGWKGVIDTSSREVEQFLNEEIIGADVGLWHYMGNAKTDEDLDLKRRENGKKVVYDSDGKRVAEHDKDDREYHHRGSYFGSRIDENGKVVPIYASARDGGNYAAGWVAGKSRIRWWAAKTMFNALEFKDSYTTEGAQSTLAQKAGHDRGKATLSHNRPKN